MAELDGLCEELIARGFAVAIHTEVWECGLPEGWKKVCVKRPVIFWLNIDWGIYVDITPLGGKPTKVEARKGG